MVTLNSGFVETTECVDIVVPVEVIDTGVGEELRIVLEGLPSFALLTVIGPDVLLELDEISLFDTNVVGFERSGEVDVCPG